jgi:hypothetical protein
LRRAVPGGTILIVLAFCLPCSSAWSQQAALVAAVAIGDEASAGAQKIQPGTEETLAASIHGVVASKDGELYEGVHVTLTVIGSGAPAPRTQSTDSDGVFNFANVPPQPFSLAISSGGFSTQTISGVLHPGETFDAETIALPMAESTSEVQVTASQQDIAVEQFHEEEKQRVLGIIPNYYVSYAPDAPPLTTRQKYSLAWKSSIDPITLLTSAAFAGVEQSENSFSGYGQGAQGYAKRFGATYADAFIGTYLSGAVFPSLFKQDPRYLYKGTGSKRSRVLYALANAVVCRGDNGHWQFDYSGILGSLAAGGIANLYYPSTNRDGAGLTFKETGLGIAGSAVGNLFQEFVIRRLTPRVPRYESEN